jgi:6-phosphogluconolactonase (cycloisomerase 2 family)
MSNDKREKSPESSELVHRRAFLQVAAGAAAGAAVAGGFPEIAAAQQKSKSDPSGGSLYMQTNEIQNAIIHYHRDAKGALTEVKRVPTGGAGSGVVSPIYHISRPNDFEGAGSVILSPDRRLLFTTNAGDNSVSSFAVGEDGEPKLVDVKRTGNATNGGAKSLAYAPSKGMLYVLHTVGPDHIRLMSVDSEGQLTPRQEQFSVNTRDWPNRGPTMVVLSPDAKFLMVGTTFDELPSKNYPDGSVVIWVPHGPDGSLHIIGSNAPDPDGIVVFPLRKDGTLGEAKFQDAKGASPFYIAFLHGRPNTFVIGYALSDGCAMATIDGDGNINVGPLVKIDTSTGLPSELCWLAVSPDDRFVYATPFGYSSLSSFRIDGNTLSIAKDPACPRVPGDGTFRALNATVGSGPSDNWLTPDGAYIYQIYGNASTLVGYATQPDGSLHEVTRVKIPYNSPQGLAGF